MYACFYGRFVPTDPNYPRLRGIRQIYSLFHHFRRIWIVVYPPDSLHAIALVL